MVLTAKCCFFMLRCDVTSYFVVTSLYVVTYFSSNIRLFKFSGNSMNIGDELRINISLFRYFCASWLLEACDYVCEYGFLRTFLHSLRLLILKLSFCFLKGFISKNDSFVLNAYFTGSSIFWESNGFFSILGK